MAGIKICNQVRSGGMLGVVDGRVGHDQTEKPRGRRHGGEDHGGRVAVPARGRDRRGQNSQKVRGEPGECQHG